MFFCSQLPPEESKKRQERRERNKEAAARCRRKREDLSIKLTKETEILMREQESIKRKFQELLEEKTRLQSLYEMHEKSCKTSKTALASGQPQQPSTQSQPRVHKQSKQPPPPPQQQLQQQEQHRPLIQINKEHINEIIRTSSEKKQSKLLCKQFLNEIYF